MTEHDKKTGTENPDHCLECHLGLDECVECGACDTCGGEASLEENELPESWLRFMEKNRKTPV